MDSRNERWPAGVIWLHWIMAALVLAILVIGYVAEHQAAGAGALALYEAHFSLGLLAILLLVARLAYRLTTRGPRHEFLSPIRRNGARLVHFALYLTMAAALVSGWVNFMFLGPIRVFGLFEMPRLFDPETQEPLRALSWYVHHYSWPVLLALVALHSAAALQHQVFHRDGILTDFLPSRR